MLGAWAPDAQIELASCFAGRRAELHRQIARLEFDEVNGEGQPMATLKEFEEELRQQGMHVALAILQRLRERDKAKRSIAPARRVTGKKMTKELAHRILELHASTSMTQQEIAFELGVNQGRVNEVIKRGKWLTDDPHAPERVARDEALARLAGRPRPRTRPKKPIPGGAAPMRPDPGRTAKKRPADRQLTFTDL